jgi:D-arabinose 1-dehydrogenase-like Zn-dependent alcohol dehydrogenase
LAGCTDIIGVDINSKKFEIAMRLGATHCFNSLEVPDKDIKKALLARQKWGYDFTFDCTGIVKVMRDALEVAHRGWGESCIIGVAAAGQEIQTRPFQLVTGRNWKGTAFGGYKSRTEVPQLVQRVMRNELPIDEYITHEYDGIENVNKSIEALHSGDCLRAVINISDIGRTLSKKPQGVIQKQNVKIAGGFIKQIQHNSRVNDAQMTFSIFYPEQTSVYQAPPPILYYLSGLTCTD